MGNEDRMGYLQLATATTMSARFGNAIPSSPYYCPLQAVVNGVTFQPAVAVDNKKDGKANAAWFALQELGLVKRDASNPL